MLQPVPASDPAAEITAWWRLVALCLPSHEECGAITFVPAGGETLEADWDRWVAGVFLPVLHPSLAALQSAAARQDAVAVLAEDAALGAELPADVSGGSLAADAICSPLSSHPKVQGCSRGFRRRRGLTLRPVIWPPSLPPVGRHFICPSCRLLGRSSSPSVFSARMRQGSPCRLLRPQA